MNRLYLRISNFVAGMFIYLALLNIPLGGNEIIIGAFLAGFVATYKVMRTLVSIVISISVILLFYLLLTVYFYIYNPYGVIVMLATGPLLYVPIILSLLSSIAGALVESSIFSKIK